VDVRLHDGDFPAAPANGITLWGPETEVPAASDKLLCFYGTYHGPNVGIHQYDVYQNEYGHHILLFGTTLPQVDAPDGYIEDCTDPNSQSMVSSVPLIVAPTFGAGANEFTLAEGMGAPLNDGDRWMIQAHYLNTSNKPILVKDAINLGFLNEDEVQTWTSPFAFTNSSVDVPVGESSLDVNCTVDATYSVLFLFGHMHEWGTHMSIERVGPTAEMLYSVDEWDPVYRDAPPVNDYSGAPIAFNAGDQFRVNCNWNNDTESDIPFPSEMCAASGMLYPARTAVICDDTEYRFTNGRAIHGA
jgi:hypothetical protein